MNQETVPAAWQWFLDDKVDVDSLPEDISIIVGLVGRERTALLLSRFAGMQIYFPSLKHAFARHRAARIRAEFNGTNQKALARKFGLSEPRVYEILKHSPEDQK